MYFVAIALVFVTPLILVPGWSFYFDVVPKAAFLLVGVAILLAGRGRTPAAVWRFVTSRSGRRYALMAFLLVSTTAIATLFSPSPGMAWNGSNWRRFGALEQIAAVLAALVISALCAQSRGLVKKLVTSICLCGVIAGLYGISQYFGWDPLLPRDAYQAGEGPFRIVRPPGPLGHSDYFGAFLLWPFFCGLGLIVTKRSKASRRLGFAALFITGSAILLAGSRGALAGLVVGLICFSALTRPRLRTVAISVSAAAVCLGLFFASPAANALRARAHWIGDDPAGGARLLLWRDSLQMSLERPWTGYGPDTFVAQFPKYQSVELARAYPDFYHESPHNIILDELTNSGILAALALIGLFAAGIAGGLRASTTDGISPTLLSAVCAVFVAQQFAVFTLPTAFYFYLGSGLLAGMDCEVAGAVQVPRLFRAFAGVASPAAAILFVTCGVRLTLADHSLAAAKHSLDAGDAQSAFSAYQSALSRRDTGVTADLYFSRRWALAATEARNPLAGAQLAQFAHNAALRSVEISEQRQNAWYNLATIAAANSNYSLTESSLRSAILCSPNWFKPHWSLSRLLFATGHPREAQDEAALALRLDAQKDAEVVATTAEILRSRAVVE